MNRSPATETPLERAARLELEAACARDAAEHYESRARRLTAAHQDVWRHLGDQTPIPTQVPPGHSRPLTREEWESRGGDV